MISSNSDRCLAYAEGSPACVTALNPYIGNGTGKSLRQIVLKWELISLEALAQVLDLEKMSAIYTSNIGGYRGKS